MNFSKIKRQYFLKYKEKVDNLNFIKRKIQKIFKYLDKFII